MSLSQESVGVRPQVIEAIRSGRAPMGLPPKEGVFAQAGKEFVRNGALSERTFQAIEHLLGPEGAVELGAGRGVLRDAEWGAGVSWE